ncbi:hypothetical protein [Aureispira anguillae]|uniref:Uncharacterized protein n=1 Tax=Aureispira anguillae TaxID=2864201 RepID=A0A915VK15_9BACT|nr:hypothetical protein [Aureispira anguillae]BDS09462.1 hypothetical protein AsAng_0001600 [Aureispira anguillae]
MFIRVIYLLIGIAILNQGCSNPSDQTTKERPSINLVTPSAQSQNIFQDNFKAQKEIHQQVFSWVMDSTYYTNPSLLVKQLGLFYGQKNVAQTTIVAFEQQRLYGLKDSVWFINCQSISEDSDCAYPTMHTQYLFNHQGKLIHKNQAAIAQFIPAVLDSLPIYMSINHDCSGNGQHHFYVYQQGKLIDIFNVLLNNTPKTYDANPEGKGMFRKKHLDWFIQDLNQDGYNDILLKGKWLVLENDKGKKVPATRPLKAERVAYKFIYKPTKEYFLLE